MKPVLLAAASVPLALTIALAGCSGPAASGSLGAGSVCAVKWKAVAEHGAQITVQDQATMKLLNAALKESISGADVATVAADWKTGLLAERDGIAMLDDGSALVDAAKKAGC